MVHMSARDRLDETGNSIKNKEPKKFKVNSKTSSPLKLKAAQYKSLIKVGITNNTSNDFHEDSMKNKGLNNNIMSLKQFPDNEDNIIQDL